MPGGARAGDGGGRVPAPTPGRILAPEREGNCLLLNRDGYVLTTRHIVSGSHGVLVKFCGSETWFAGVVRDTSSDFDLALVELTQFGDSVASLEPATFADSLVLLEVGEEVRINPADRRGECDAGVFGRIRSMRTGEESANILTIFSGHSGSALVGTETGLVLGVLYASEVARVDRPEEYLLPPFRFVPASDVRSYLDGLNVDYRADHPEPPMSGGRKWFRRLAVVGCAACFGASALEHSRADGYYEDYLDAGCGEPDDIESIRLSVEAHDRAASYWLGAAVVLGVVALWEYEVPQGIWRSIKGGD